MRKIIVGAFVSLDGVMQSPGGPAEDPTGGFTLGGWTVPWFDDAVGRELGASRDGGTNASDLLRDSTLYTTGEPCAMCMGAILWCHFRRLVFAAPVDQLATRIEQTQLDASRVRREQ